jgi:hypothetical protein
MAIHATPLLICDHVYEDPVSHNVTLLGIFTSLRATKFPSPFRVMSVYTQLEGDAGEFGDVTLRCESAADGRVIAEETYRVQIGVLGTRHVHIRLDDLRFPQPGPYRFSLVVDHEIIGERTILVTEGN